jgi:hypothetical protein
VPRGSGSAVSFSRYSSQSALGLASTTEFDEIQRKRHAAWDTARSPWGATLSRFSRPNRHAPRSAPFRRDTESVRGNSSSVPSSSASVESPGDTPGVKLERIRRRTRSA